MTFYSYKIINRSTETLNETYFGQWVDPDLGNYQDDYVGCDVELGLGYCYNGDADDDWGSNDNNNNNNNNFNDNFTDNNEDFEEDSKEK